MQGVLLTFALILGLQAYMCNRLIWSIVLLLPRSFDYLDWLCLAGLLDAFMNIGGWAGGLGRYHAWAQLFRFNLGWMLNPGYCHHIAVMPVVPANVTGLSAMDVIRVKRLTLAC